MKKSILLILALAMVGGVLVGCSGGAESGGDGVEKTTGATPKTKADERGEAKSAETPL